MPYGRNFRGAGSRSDQCSVKAWVNKIILRLDLKTDRVADENCLRQRVPDSRCWKSESTPGKVCPGEHFDQQRDSRWTTNKPLQGHVGMEINLCKDRWAWRQTSGGTGGNGDEPLEGQVGMEMTGGNGDEPLEAQVGWRQTFGGTGGNGDESLEGQVGMETTGGNGDEPLEGQVGMKTNLWRDRWEWRRQVGMGMNLWRDRWEWRETSGGTGGNGDESLEGQVEMETTGGNGDESLEGQVEMETTGGNGDEPLKGQVGMKTYLWRDRWEWRWITVHADLELFSWANDHLMSASHVWWLGSLMLYFKRRRQRSTHSIDHLYHDHWRSVT